VSRTQCSANTRLACHVRGAVPTRDVCHVRDEVLTRDLRVTYVEQCRHETCVVKY
jgi:hypothetical protein